MHSTRAGPPHAHAPSELCPSPSLLLKPPPHPLTPALHPSLRTVTVTVTSSQYRVIRGKTCCIQLNYECLYLDLDLD